ncbi:hypothetical protein [Bacteroides sp.]|uniref:hypothetical protein n=1 Tax=Bacteroides sp. TaxID=29523 RepID=UPI00263315C1|nr:hypothetical protein [Bacteroides sp.]MDD3038375.1 hypothetical protein [Bacteroides sp.]
MENDIIEKMETKRFYALLVRTIVGMFLMTSTIWGVYCMDNGISNRYESIWFNTLNILFLVVTWRASSVLGKIRKDRRLMGALNSEIYSVYNYKSLSTGFYAALISGLFLFVFGGLLNFSIRVGCLMLITITLFSAEIRRLILYKP